MTNEEWKEVEDVMLMKRPDVVPARIAWILYKEVQYLQKTIDTHTTRIEGLVKKVEDECKTLQELLNIEQRKKTDLSPLGRDWRLKRMNKEDLKRPQFWLDGKPYDTYYTFAAGFQEAMRRNETIVIHIDGFPGLARFTPDGMCQLLKKGPDTPSEERDGHSYGSGEEFTL